MALRLSTGMRQAMMGIKPTYTATTIGATAPAVKSFTDSASQFLIKGFRPGDVILSDVASNVGLFTIASLVAGTITTVEATAVQAAGASYTLNCITAKGFKDLFHAGIMDIYSGSQPANADAVEVGTKLLSITVSAGAFTAGTATNGLDFDDPAAGVLSKAAGETWQDAGIAAGTAGWFRFYDNEYKTGASAVGIRFDGSVGISGADLNLSSVSIAIGATTTIATFTVTLPANA